MTVSPVPLEALVLIVLAAFAHSAWNLLAKQAAQAPHLIWFSSAGECLLFLPVAITILADSWPRMGGRATLCLLATGAIHWGYAESLVRGYRLGDLSVVYPVARGSGPLLSFVGAILLLGERASLAAVAGVLLVCGGILLVCGGWSLARQPRAREGLRWGMVTGLTIAAYTLVDGYSIRVLVLSPFLVEYAGTAFRTVALTGAAWKARPLAAEYRQCWRQALGISILLPAGYLLVLFAMRLAPVSHIAPAREMSMMIGAWFGVKLLGEGHLAQRMAGSVLIAAGVAGLVLG